MTLTLSANDHSLDGDTWAQPEIRTLDDVRGLFRTLGNCCRAAVQGRDEVIALVLTALFADGHVLLEDHPGSGKTTLANALGHAILAEDAERLASFRRIQFTPDALPSDITGSTWFDSRVGRFEFRAGPIFANVVLADEINRTSPKVQAALLEAMAEKQVTVDNQTHKLDALFFVLATQNPLDMAGTYPLPRAQLDRFLFKIRMGFLTPEKELEVLARKKQRSPSVAFKASPSVLVAARRLTQDAVQVSPLIQRLLVEVANALRKDKRVALGVSTRSLVQAMPALQVWALMHGRDYVSPRDVKTLAVPLFAHRLDLAAGVKDADAVVTDCVTPLVEAYTRKSL